MRVEKERGLETRTALNELAENHVVRAGKAPGLRLLVLPEEPEQDRRLDSRMAMRYIGKHLAHSRRELRRVVRSRKLVEAVDELLVFAL